MRNNTWIKGFIICVSKKIRNISGEARHGTVTLIRLVAESCKETPRMSWGNPGKYLPKVKRNVLVKSPGVKL